MKMNAVLWLFLLSSVCFVSCTPYGCTDEYADNYEEDAIEDDGTCTYSSRTISFYTNSTIGGEIYIELSVSPTEDYFSNYGEEYPSATFNFDPNDAYYPLCGYENLANFERYTTRKYYYDAHDKDGNVWSGTVSAQAGECKQVELFRDPNAYGTIHLYSTNTGSDNLRAVSNPTGSDSDNDRSIEFNLNSIYSSTEPICGQGTEGILRSKVGSAIINVQNTNPFNKKVDVNINVVVNPQGCTIVNLADYI